MQKNKRIIKETIELFKERKIIFEKNRIEFDCHFVNKEKENTIRLNTIGIFNKGLVYFTSLDTQKLKEMEYENKSKLIQEIVSQLKKGGSFAYKLNILLTSEEGYVVQHELQHAFDSFIKLDDGIVAKEYRAYLAGLKYGGKAREHLDMIYSNMELIITEGLLFNVNERFKGNYLAMARIISMFREYKREITSEKIIHISSKLLDESYEDTFGMGYDGIVKKMCETNSPFISNV